MLPDAAVELVFDRPMDRQAVAGAFTLQLAADQPKPVSGQVRWVDDQTMQFRPDGILPRAATYDAILTQAAKSEDGDFLDQPYTFRFMTAGFLEVAQVVPEAGAVDIETKPTITVIFNRPVVPLTSLAEAENLPQPLEFEPDVEGTGEWLNTSIYVFTPEEALSGGTTYSVKVKEGLEDISGAILGDDFEWQFTTQPPEVVWSDPRDGAVQIPIDATISVQFNQPIDPDSAIEAFSLNSNNLFGADVKGDFNVVNNTLTFTPHRTPGFRPDLYPQYRGRRQPLKRAARACVRPTGSASQPCPCPKLWLPSPKTVIARLRPAPISASSSMPPSTRLPLCPIWS